MEDMERYGDYTEYEDDQPKKKGAFLTVLKILTAIVCACVIGVLGFRIILSSYYPKDIKRLYFNDILTSYYNEKNGDIDAKTLKIYAPYEDNRKGRFFAANLIFIDGADQMQLTVRLNKQVYKELSEEYGVEINADSFSFSLLKSVKHEGEISAVEYPIAESIIDVDKTSYAMYDCFKLVCDGVDWDFSEENKKDEWLVLQISVAGVDYEARNEKGELINSPFKIVLYRNKEDFTRLKDYDLARKERP